MILVLEDVAIVEMRNRGRRSVGVRSICTPKKLLTVTLQLMKCNKTNLRSFVITFSHRNRISAVFDVVPILCKSEDEPHRTIYGQHPNWEGCKKWAQTFAPIIEKVLAI